MIEVRRVEPDDLPVLWTLNGYPNTGFTADASVPLPLPPRSVPPAEFPDLADPLATVVAAGGEFVVALRDGALVGMGGLRPVGGRPHVGRVTRIRVHPATRRDGVGRQVMAALEAASERLGLTDLILETGDNQPEALAFYRALGWSETWRESRPEWTWNLVWFHRSLTRDHLTVDVRPCGGDADADAAEAALPSRGRGVHHARWRRQQDGEATYLLAWHGDEVVGHVLLLRRSAYPEVEQALGPHPEVHALGVAERARRRHVGTALLGTAAGMAREQGARLVGLAVDPGNDPATTMCRRLGWRRRPGLAPVEEWSWLDERGGRHEEADRCEYWTLPLPAEVQRALQ